MKNSTIMFFAVVATVMFFTQSVFSQLSPERQERLNRRIQREHKKNKDYFDKQEERDAIARAKTPRINDKWDRNQEVYKRRLGLRCPFGGYDDVKIAVRLGEETQYMGVAQMGKSYFRRTLAIVRATNEEMGVVDIDDVAGPVVENMCAGGRITLVYSMTAGEYHSVNVFWTARGINSQTRLGNSVSTQTFLTGGWWMTNQNNSIWRIKLFDDTGNFFQP